MYSHFRGHSRSLVPGDMCVHFLYREFLGWIVSGMSEIYFSEVDIWHPGGFHGNQDSIQDGCHFISTFLIAIRHRHIVIYIFTSVYQNVNHGLFLFENWVFWKQYNNTASNIEKIGLQRQHLTNLREAENLTEKSKEREKTSASFTAIPFSFAKSLLEGKPTCSKEDSHLQQTHSNKQRDIQKSPFGWCSCIKPVSEPEMET